MYSTAYARTLPRHVAATVIVETSGEWAIFYGNSTFAVGLVDRDPFGGIKLPLRGTFNIIIQDIDIFKHLKKR